MDIVKEVTMNPIVKALWVEALESGKYTQGQHRLKAFTNEYCCFGVLCDLHRKHTGYKHKWETHGYGNIPSFSYMGDNLGVSAQVLKWAGIPSLSVRIQGRTLISYNDSLGFSFKHIAQLINDNL